ncbi:hypothetical protein DRW48_10410 [Paracoccus suum]|uniref:Uncharacterized protein n=1 Tax=Paracoccus suum TaxID=2259340 RepID=A0A344PKZ2_9RHOB|nr:hypothetical protein [Paracoccus suum]AXC50047.1 hypothetical protein DRW48_10410 [Paracoccus suum]
MSLASSIYRWTKPEGLTPEETAARNAACRRDIAAGTGWAVIDMDQVPGWPEREIIARENARQNGVARWAR